MQKEWIGLWQQQFNTEVLFFPFSVRFFCEKWAGNCHINISFTQSYTSAYLHMNTQELKRATMFLTAQDEMHNSFPKAVWDIKEMLTSSLKMHSGRKNLMSTISYIPLMQLEFIRKRRIFTSNTESGVWKMKRDDDLSYTLSFFTRT